jgi:stress response protein YsnF
MDPYDLDAAIGSDAYDPDGTKVGRVGQVYLDDQTDEPTWASVRTGLFGTRESFVPLEGSAFDDGRLTVAYSKDVIQDAPSVDAHGHLSPEEEAELYAYYGGTASDASALAEDGTDTAAAAAPPDGASTRSEERLDVGTTSEVTGSARLRKYVVVEDEQVTVPVRREKVVLETEGGERLAPPSAAGSGEASGAAHAGTPVGAAAESGEIILHEERPVVSTETVPVERVRLDTVAETVEERVSAPVRKERVVLEDDVPPRRAAERDAGSGSGAPQ